MSQKILETLLCSDLIQCYYDYECPAMYSSLCKKFKNKSILAILFQSSKWKFAITGPNQILEFIFI
jgi:hypothetical protein